MVYYKLLNDYRQDTVRRTQSVIDFKLKPNWEEKEWVLTYFENSRNDLSVVAFEITIFIDLM